MKKEYVRKMITVMQVQVYSVIKYRLQLMTMLLMNTEARNLLFDQSKHVFID